MTTKGLYITLIANNTRNSVVFVDGAINLEYARRLRSGTIDDLDFFIRTRDQVMEMVANKGKGRPDLINVSELDLYTLEEYDSI